jgi:hypothetical protein
MVVPLGARWYQGCGPSAFTKLHRSTARATNILLGKNILVFKRKIHKLM